MAILVFSPNGTYVTKPTLEAARTSADCVGKTVVVTSALTAAQSDITAAWPADRVLEVRKGGSIANTAAFTINSPFQNGLYPIFTGTGIVSFMTGAVTSVYPEWWGGKGDGTDATATTASIISAIASLPSSTNLCSGGVVQLSEGQYAINATIPIIKSGVRISGVSKIGTNIVFTTSTPGASCFQIGYHGTGYTYDIEISHMSISSDTAQGNVQKFAIENINSSQVKIEDVRIAYWRGNGNSYGLLFRGREFQTVRDVEIYGDRGIAININTDIPSISLDMSTFDNIWIVAEQGECVAVQSGAILSNISFGGFQSWTPKTYGLLWDDSTSNAMSVNIRFQNIRIEQETTATAYMFYISVYSGLRHLVFENIYGGSVAKGFYLRNAQVVELSNIAYINALNNEALNVDAAVGHVTFKNCFWQTGVTSNLTYGIADAAGVTGSLLLPTSGVIRRSSADNYVIHKALQGRRITTNLAGIYTICNNTFTGKLVASIRGVTVAEYELLGSRNISREVRDGDGIFSATKDTATSINIYYDSVSSTYVLQQNYTDGTLVDLMLIGAYS